MKIKYLFEIEEIARYLKCKWFGHSRDIRTRLLVDHLMGSDLKMGSTL